MGLCIACCNDPPPEKLGEQDELKARKKKLRPLLFNLERDFKEHAGDDNKIDLEELKRLWKASALKTAGKLSDDESVLIDATAEETFKEIDADGSGQVSYHEFVAHSMGGMEARGALRDMREKMNAKLKANPSLLKDLVESFKAWDKNGDGYVTEQELEEHLETLAKDVQLDTAAHIFAKKMKAELLEVADVDGDGKVDLWEIIGWALGRRKTPVELILYDISKGATEWAGPLLLGRFDVEAFHSSLLIFGSEYWYGGKVFRSEPPCSKAFGDPVAESPVLKMEPSEVRPEVPVVKLGYTFVTHEEFVQFIKDKCIDRYTGIEKYDLLTHSCHHFSDECLHFLLGRGIPAHVTELQNIALTSTVKAIRPYLNRYLGGFSEQPGGGDQLLNDQKMEDGPGGIKVDDLLGAGTVVVLDAGAAGLDEEGAHVIATVLNDEGDTLEVKYLDPADGKPVTKAGVPQSAVLKRVQ